MTGLMHLFTQLSDLAIVLIFTLGGAIIWISLFLEALVGFIQLRFKDGIYYQVRCPLDSAL
jgi:hypothetical protein